MGKAEEDLNEQLRVEKLNAEIEEAHQQKQADAQSKFEEAKKKLEESGAEFVSNEEFAKVKAAKAERLQEQLRTIFIDFLFSFREAVLFSVQTKTETFLKPELGPPSVPHSEHKFNPYSQCM